MCLIIHKPEGVSVPGDLIRTAWEENPDGAGIMYRDGDLGLKVYKVAPGDWADPGGHIEKVLSDIPGEAGIHFRWKTHGPITRENIHPFAIPGDGGYIMHNGVLSDKLLGPQYKQVAHLMSDTGFYALTVLQDAPGADDPKFWEIVGSDVGSFNRMLLMDKAGRFLRVNDKSWYDYKGLRLSNMLSCPGYSTGRHYGSSGHWYYDRSDAMPTTTATDEGTTRHSAAVVIYTERDGKPAKLTRRERKILNRCLRANTWGPAKALGGP